MSSLAILQIIKDIGVSILSHVIISRHVIFDEANFPFSKNIQASPFISLDDSLPPPTSPLLNTLHSSQPVIQTESVQPSSLDPVIATAPQVAAPQPPAAPSHNMMTRGKRGITKPK